MHTSFFLAVHLYSIYATAALMLVYLGLTQGMFRSEFHFIRRIRVFLPLFYLFLAISCFTGLLLLALRGFVLDAYLIYMILSWLLILALAIFHFVRFKRARAARRYKNFRWLSLLILLFELGLLCSNFFARDLINGLFI